MVQLVVFYWQHIPAMLDRHMSDPSTLIEVRVVVLSCIRTPGAAIRVVCVCAACVNVRHTKLAGPFVSSDFGGVTRPQTVSLLLQRGLQVAGKAMVSLVHPIAHFIIEQFSRTHSACLIDCARTLLSTEFAGEWSSSLFGTRSNTPPPRAVSSHMRLRCEQWSWHRSRRVITGWLRSWLISWATVRNKSKPAMIHRLCWPTSG